MNFSEIRKYIKDTIIAKHEKGYQDDQDDEGNYLYNVVKKGNRKVRNYKGFIGTKFGISANALQANRRNPITTDDMKNLTEEEAIEIYMKDYVAPAKITKLPVGLQKNVLDASINHGHKKAIKMLQDAIKAKAKSKGMTIKENEFKSDGIYGRQTESFLKMFPVSNNDYVDARKTEYNRIISKKPSQQKFKKGWMKRAESYRDTETDDQAIEEKFKQREEFEKSREDYEEDKRKQEAFLSPSPIKKQFEIDQRRKQIIRKLTT